MVVGVGSKSLSHLQSGGWGEHADYLIQLSPKPILQEAAWPCLGRALLWTVIPLCLAASCLLVPS